MRNCTLKVLGRGLAIGSTMLVLAGCQTPQAPVRNEIPAYRFPCTWRPANAGYCEEPNNFHLFSEIMRDR